VFAVVETGEAKFACCQPEAVSLPNVTVLKFVLENVFAFTASAVWRIVRNDVGRVGGGDDGRG
jgi:hypothetical protein